MLGALQARLTADLQHAFKAREQSRTATLRLVVDALHQEEIALKRELTESEALRVLEREAKRRRETVAVYESVGRGDRASAERSEAILIEAYLPKQLADEDLEGVIRAVITEQGAGAAIGSVMSAVMSQVRGRADGARVRGLVSRILPS